jgi:16S rRNA (uracil1498-N3)-methyltransferase
MAKRFYVPKPPAAGLFVLSGPEAHHLATVSRAKVGETIHLFCGDGLDYPAIVRHVTRRAIELQVAAGIPSAREWSHRLFLACPLPKGDRAVFLIEKLTELGATDFVPLITERSIINPGEGKTERLRRVVLESSKQCGRSVLLQIHPSQPIAAFLRRPDLPAARWVADPAGPPWPAGRPPEDTVFLVGPEGGLTDLEAAAAQAAGFKPVGLGPRVLRLETAVIALASLRVA